MLLVQMPAMATEPDLPRDPILPHEPDLQEQPAAPPRAFTTAEINMLRWWLDQTRQQRNPEYYLSDAYLAALAPEPKGSLRQRNNHLRWLEARKERERARKIRQEEHVAERDRLRELRSQERKIRRVQRQAQVALHRRQLCARLQQRWAMRANHQASRRNGSGHARTIQPAYRAHPSCVR